MPMFAYVRTLRDRSHAVRTAKQRRLGDPLILWATVAGPVDSQSTAQEPRHMGATASPMHRIVLILCSKFTKTTRFFTSPHPREAGEKVNRYVRISRARPCRAHFLGERVLVRLMNASTSAYSKRSCFPMRWASIFPSRTSLHRVVLETLSLSTTSKTLSSFAWFVAIGLILFPASDMSINTCNT